MNIDIHTMLMRQRERDLLRATAQVRLAEAVMAQRSVTHEAPLTWLDSLLMVIEQRLRGLANAS